MINLVLIAVCTAGFAIFLQHCYQEGQLLSRYFDLIARLPMWLFKPLGGCLPCQSFWVNLMVVLMIQGWPGSLEEIAYVAMSTGANYLTLFILVFKDV